MGTTAQKLQAILDSKADIAAAIQEKGGTVPTKLSDYGDAIRNIQTTAEVPDIEFIDYDGRTLATYSFEEASALTELPEIPVHEGLSAQGWNYSLADVTGNAVNGYKTTIGPTYVGVISVLRFHDEIVCIGNLGRRNHLLTGGILNAERDIVVDRVIEQERLLVYVTHKAAQ